MHDRGSQGASFSDALLGAVNVPEVEAVPGVVVVVALATLEEAAAALVLVPLLLLLVEAVLALAAGALTVKLDPVVTVTSAPSVVGPLASTTSPLSRRSTAWAAGSVAVEE